MFAYGKVIADVTCKELNMKANLGVEWPMSIQYWPSFA